MRFLPYAAAVSSSFLVGCSTIPERPTPDHTTPLVRIGENKLYSNEFCLCENKVEKTKKLIRLGAFFGKIYDNDVSTLKDLVDELEGTKIAVTVVEQIWSDPSYNSLEASITFKKGIEENIIIADQNSDGYYHSGDQDIDQILLSHNTSQGQALVDFFTNRKSDYLSKYSYLIERKRKNPEEIVIGGESTEIVYKGPEGK